MTVTEKTKEHPWQQFRSSVNGRKVSVRVQIDPIAGSYIVLWRLIQHSFPDIQSLRHGNDNVYCLVDPDTMEELLPRRIQYYPDIVLDVIQGGPPLIRPGTEDSDKLHCSISSQTISILNLDNDCGDTIEPHTGPLESKSTNPFQDINHGSHSILRFENMVPQEQISAGTYSSLRESYVKTMVESFKDHADNAKASIIASMKEELASMKEELAKNHAQLLEKDRENKEKGEIMMAMQKQILEIQEDTRSRVVDVQNRAQALFTLTYELFEYRIPRLFIVLPMQQSVCNKLNPLNYKFRLYFLCECGEHTKKKSSSNKMPHHIHLAKHVGYDVLRPTEFFQKYGSYLVTMMEMIKFGVSCAGFVVPTLAQLKILDGIGEIKNQLDFTEKTFAPLLDDSISFTKGHTGQDLSDPGLDGKNDVMAQEAWEGAELRQLKMFLSKVDEEGTLGNLCRTKTDDGHIKWVCSDHHRDVYLDSIPQRFANVVTSNGGVFTDDLGKLTISLSTPLKAQEFYNALKGAKGVHELIINPLWDAIKSDIQQLCDAIFESNVSLLGVGGRYFDGPKTDVINRGSRFDPFIQLLSSGKLQSFTIEYCPRFLDRISGVPSPVAPKLLALNLCYYYSAKELKTARHKIVDLLQRFPSLTEATVGCLDIDELFELLPIQQLQRLPVLHLQRMMYFDKVTLVLSNGAVKHMDLWADNVPKLAYSGFLRQFEMVAMIISLTDLERLLCTNMGLTKLLLKMAENFFEYIFLIDTLMPTRCKPLEVILNETKQFVKMEFWDAAKVPPADPTGKWIQLPHSMVHVQEWRNMIFNFQQMDSNIEIIISGLEEMAHDADVVKLDLDMSLLTEAGIGILKKTMASLRPRECDVIFKKYKQEWARCYDFDPVCWSKLLKLKVSGEDMAIWLQSPASAFRKELIRSSRYFECLTIQGQGNQPSLSDDLTSWLTYVASKRYFQSLKELTISYARFSHESWRTILRSIDYSDLHSLNLRQCGLAVALPGSRNDAVYTIADLCRYVGLRTGHQQQATGFVLAQGTGDDLTFERKSNSISA